MFDSPVTACASTFNPIAFASQNPPRIDRALDRTIARMIDRRRADRAAQQAQLDSDLAKLLSWQTTISYATSRIW